MHDRISCITLQCLAGIVLIQNAPTVTMETTATGRVTASMGFPVIRSRGRAPAGQGSAGHAAMTVRTCLFFSFFS